MYGILIPNKIDSIPSIDGINRRYRRWGETLMDGVCDEDDYSYTLEEYQKKFAIVGTDGKLYWKE